MMGKSIEHLKQKNDIAGLVKLLGAKNFETESVDALVEIGAPAAEAVVEKLVNATNMSVFFKAFLAVTRIGEPCVAALIKHLNQSQTLNRGAVASALGNISRSVKDQTVIISMLTPLLSAFNDPNQDVKKAIAEALGDVGSRLTLSNQRDQLSEALEYRMTAADPVVREAISAALEKMGRKASQVGAESDRSRPFV
jgi:HEAT repeat protein